MSGTVKTALAKVIEAYKRANPIRTADFHKHDCDCLRCAIDNAEAALSRTTGDT